MPPNYDSLLGKLIVWGEDRTQAIARMKRALNELVISGVPTTTQYHEMILEIEDFVNGNVDTGFIPKHADQLTDPPPPKTSVSANACRYPSAHCVPSTSSWQSKISQVFHAFEVQGTKLLTKAFAQDLLCVCPVIAALLSLMHPWVSSQVTSIRIRCQVAR